MLKKINIFLHGRRKNKMSEENKELSAAQRMQVCMDCEHLFKPTRQCKQCGCFMKVKTRMKNATCPIGKW